MKNLLTASIASLLVASSMATSRVISFNVYWDTGGADVYGQVTTEHGVSTVPGSKTTGWVNSASGSQNNVAFSDGTTSTVDILATRPTNSPKNGADTLPANSTGAQNGLKYDGTVLRGYIKAGLAAGKEAKFTISDLNASFPNGYKVLAFLGGENRVNRASVSFTTNSVEGAKYFYKTSYNPAATSAPNRWQNDEDFRAATTTGNLTSSSPTASFPVANYAEFDADADVIVITVDNITSLDSAPAGLSGVQIIGNAVPAPEAPVLPIGAAFYDDFSGLNFDIGADFLMTPEVISRNKNTIPGNKAKEVYRYIKDNPWTGTNSKDYAAGHNYQYTFANVSTTSAKSPPSDSTGNAALKVGDSGPKTFGGLLAVNTGLRYDPRLNYTVTIRAKVKDNASSTILTNAVGNIGVGISLANMQKYRNPVTQVSNITATDLSTEWQEYSTTIYGGNLGNYAVLGYNTSDSTKEGQGYGKNQNRHRLGGEFAFSGPRQSQIYDTDFYRPQEIILTFGRGENTTNTLDHVTWLDWVKIETNDALATAATAAGVDVNNLAYDSDSDGLSDLEEIARGSDPLDPSSVGSGLEFVEIFTVPVTNWSTNTGVVVSDVSLPGHSQNDDGQIARFVSYPLTNWANLVDAKHQSLYGEGATTNIVAASHRFVSDTWTNYYEFNIPEGLTNVVKWKEATTNIVDLTSEDFHLVTDNLWSGARVSNNNHFKTNTLSGFYTNHLDGFALVQTYITNIVYVTKTAEVSYVETDITSRTRAKLRQNMSDTAVENGIKYHVLSCPNLNFSSFSNSGSFARGSRVTNGISGYIEQEVSSYIGGVNGGGVSQIGDQYYLREYISTPTDDPASHYFDTYPTNFVIYSGE